MTLLFTRHFGLQQLNPMFIVLEAVGQNGSRLFMNIMRKIIKPSLRTGLMGLVDTCIQMLTRSLVIFMRKIM